MVHYTLDHGPCAGQCRAAVMTRVVDEENGIVNLQLFPDGANDEWGRQHWLKEIPYEESGHTHNTWHWPQECELQPMTDNMPQTYLEPPGDNAGDSSTPPDDKGPGGEPEAKPPAEGEKTPQAAQT